jgi:Ferritin-like domain
VGLKTRRELIASASGAGLGATGALFGPHLAAASAKSASAGLADRRKDLRALESLASAERLLQYCYTAVLESGALKRASMNVVLLAYGHEQAHAAAVQAAIVSVQRQIVALSAGAAQSQAASPPPPAQIVKLFKNLHHEAFCITQLSRVEAYVQAQYFHAVSELGEPELVKTATQILGAKAQQWSLFQDLLSHGKVLHTVPVSSVRGSATLPK